MRGTPLLSLALLLAGCGGGGANTADAADTAAGAPGGEEAAGAAAKPVAQVRTAVATRGRSSDEATLYGASEAGAGAERALIAPAEAIVARVLAPTGTAVGVGAAVVALQPSRTTRLDIAKAASETQVALAAFARAQRLRADGLVSNADVETARAALATATATRSTLGLGTGGTVLRAPVAGTVQALVARPGDQIAAGTAIATIAVRGDLRARFGIDPAAAQRVHVGQPVRIDTIAGGKATTVTVVGVDPQVDPLTRLASVYVRIPAAMGLGAGEPLRATIGISGAGSGGIGGATAVDVPYTALLDDGGRSYVFVVRGAVARRVGVAPGSSSGDTVQILKGLNPGDRVVTEGGTAIEDGMAVRDVGGAGGTTAGAAGK